MLVPKCKTAKLLESGEEQSRGSLPVQSYVEGTCWEEGSFGFQFQLLDWFMQSLAKMHKQHCEQD